MKLQRSVTRRSLVAGAMTLLAAPWVAGCRLQRPALNQRTFLVTALADLPAEHGRDGGMGILSVRPFRVSPAFDSRAFVVRVGEAEYTTDPFHAFLVSPGPMLGEAFADGLRRAGVFAGVTSGGGAGAASPTHALDVEVTEFYGDYRDRGQPAAVLAIRARLVHPVAGVRSVIRWERDFSRRVAIPEASPEALVAGWSRGVGELCAALAVLLSERPPDPTQPQA